MLKAVNRGPKTLLSGDVWSCLGSLTAAENIQIYFGNSFHGSYSELIQLKRFRPHRCHCSPPGCRLPVLILAVNAAANTSDFQVPAGGKNNNCIGAQTLPNGGEACKSSSDAMKHNFRPRPPRGRRAELAKLSVRLDRSDGSCTSTPGN